MRTGNLAVRFILELTALAATGYWGATLPVDRVWRVVAAIAMPCLVALFWGGFVSPKAPASTGVWGRATLGFAVFSLAAWALWQRGHPLMAGGYWTVALVSSVLMGLWRQ